MKAKDDHECALDLQAKERRETEEDWGTPAEGFAFLPERTATPPPKDEARWSTAASINSRVFQSFYENEDRTRFKISARNQNALSTINQLGL